MTTEDFLAILLRYTMGQEPEDIVLAAVASNLSLSQERHRQYQAEFPPGNPELNVQLREEIDKGFADYFEALNPLVQETSPEAVSTALPLLQQAIRVIRGAQLEHQRSLAEGPTMLPFLNRFLLHYDFVRTGGDRSRLQSLVAEYPTFIQWLSKELGKRDTDPSTSALLFQLRGFFSSVQTALGAEESLPPVSEEIVEIGQVLSEALMVEPFDTEDGPTQIPAVNLVFEALATLTGDHEELGYMLSLLSQCRQYLRASCPTRSKPEMIKALGEVLSTLERMEGIFRGKESFEALEDCAERLEQETNTLYSLVQEMSESEVFKSELFDQQTEGLPPFYKSLLLPAYQMVEAGGNPEHVEAAADYLEASSEYYESLLARAGDEDSKILVEESLAAARDAARLLRSLAEEGNPALLTLICMNCAQSVDKLREAGVPLR